MRKDLRLQFVLLAYGITNAALYSMMLPLWEGFDEPFHFGYVQQLANGQGFPDPRFTCLSVEVGSSMLIAPASSVVKHNLPKLTSYSDYFSSPRSERAARQVELRELPRDSRWQPSEFVNYEAHHAPLAYVLLALPERILARVALPNRVLVLRIIAALIGTILLYAGANRLFSELGLRDPYKSAAMFCILSSQMIWATIAHVANDWLAIPLTVWSLAMIITYWKASNLRTASSVAVLLSLGLLTKAYFIAIVPMALLLFPLRRKWKDLQFAMAIILLAIRALSPKSSG